MLAASRRDHLFDRRDFGNGRQGGDGRPMGRLAEGGAAVGQDDGVGIAHMRVAHGRGDAAIGHDAAEDQRPNAGGGSIHSMRL